MLSRQYDMILTCPPPQVASGSVLAFCNRDPKTTPNMHVGWALNCLVFFRCWLDWIKVTGMSGGTSFISNVKIDERGRKAGVERVDEKWHHIACANLPLEEIPRCLSCFHERKIRFELKSIWPTPAAIAPVMHSL
jgi:hypothetical protein